MPTINKPYAHLAGIATLLLMSGCATLTNDPNQPVEFLAPGCQKMQCTATNKRGSWKVSPPETVSIRRSDDSLAINCTDNSGRKHERSVESKVSDSKLNTTAALFGLLGMAADTVSDKHRAYPEKILLTCE